MTKKQAEPITYVLYLADGKRRFITVPAHYKLTFGQLVPYTGRRGDSYSVQPALRIYEGNKENLRSVMNDVVGFRDVRIEITETEPSIRGKEDMRPYLEAVSGNMPTF